MVTRSSKRKNSEAAEPSPSKKSASKKGTSKSASEAPSPIEEIEDDNPSGYPFTELEIEWIPLRNPKGKLSGVKVSFGGYETAGTDVGNVTRSLPRNMLEGLSKSCMGEFLRMQFPLTRCQQMTCFIMNHEVTPKPNFDKTARFFKFGDVVCRFGRKEYALVSGLKFGPANFDPYGKHEIPENSVFQRLFGGDDETTLADLRNTYINITASPEDIVKLSKMYIAVSWVLGFDASKKKIPGWLWVLVENDEEWEKFPWGSLAFQTLLSNIDGFKRSGNNFTLKGDTIGFSAWVYEVLPILGEILGERAKYPAIPRFLRYSYSMMKRGGFPKEESIITETVQFLEPTEEEEETVWWKSLELEPSEDGFALKYDQYYAKRKDSRRDKGDEDEEDSRQGKAHVNSEVAVQLMEKMKELMDARDKKMKDMLDEMREKIVDEVAEKVAKTLLENAPHCNDPNFDHVVDIAKAYNIVEEAAGEKKNGDGGEGQKAVAAQKDDASKAKTKEGMKKGEKKNGEGEVSEGNDPKTPVDPKV